jgi:hypothetical protein
VHAALLQHPRRELEALREAGIGHADLARLTAHLSGQDEAIPKVSGDMSDEQIASMLNAVERSENGKVLRVLSAVRRELDQPRRPLNAVTFEGDWLVHVDGEPERLPRIVTRMVRATGGWLSADTPILILDGTGSLLLNRLIFGQHLREESYKVERLGRLVQTKGKSFSKASLLGAGRSGTPLREGSVQQAELLRDGIVALLMQLEGRGNVLLASSKQVEEAMRDEVPEFCVTGHFGALRGVNTYQDCLVVVVLGREQPPIAHIENIACAFAATRPEPFQSTLDPQDPSCRELVPCIRRRRMRDGRVSVETVEVHPDPLAQEVLEQFREAGVVQALDRVRPIFGEREMYMLNNLVIDGTVDDVVSWPDLRSGRRHETRLEEAWDRSPIRLLSAAELARVFPDLWPSAEAAKKDLQRREKGDTALIDSYLDDVPFLEVRYWRGDSQAKPYRALVPGSCLHPRQALEALVGPVRRAEVTGQPLKTADPQQPTAAAVSESDSIILPAAAQADLFDMPPTVPRQTLEDWKKGPMPSSIRRAFRHEITRRGLRQAEAANRIGVSRPQLANVLQGRSGLGPTAAAGVRAFILEAVGEDAYRPELKR